MLSLQPRLDVAKNLAYIANSGPLWQDIIADQPGWKFTFAGRGRQQCGDRSQYHSPDGSSLAGLWRWDWASINVMVQQPSSVRWAVCSVGLRKL